MTVQERQTGLHRAPPELWPQLGGEEARGPSSAAASAGVADTAAVAAGAAVPAAVEAVMAPLVPGVQKPPRWVGKRFWDHFAAAARLKAYRPRDVQTTPAWPRGNRLGACPAVGRDDADCRRGVRNRTGLQAADGDDLVSGPNLHGEGAGAAADGGELAVVQRL